jgi:hypothetical protein
MYVGDDSEINLEPMVTDRISTPILRLIRKDYLKNHMIVCNPEQFIQEI